MTINLKLAPVATVDEDTDPMNRGWIGWKPGLSDQDAYEQNRGVWRLGARARHERYATFSCDGRVRVVITVDGIEKIPSLDDKPAKDALIGRVLRPGDVAYEALIDQPVDNFRNPVTYGPDPSGEPHRCGCGCGSLVPLTRVFLPGHDQRAIHDRISHEWGSTLAFVRWFDATYGTPRDTQPSTTPA